MKKIKQFMAIIFISLFTFNSFESKAQSGTLISKNGFVLYYSSDSLNFTLRLDEPNTEIPLWIAGNYLQVFKDHLYIQAIDMKSIIHNNNSSNDKLYSLQKWETDYIESNMNSSVKRSPFINDTNSITLNDNNLKFNSWYYSVELSSGRLYFYFYDIYTKGQFLRITFTGNLDTARLFIPVVLKGILFYNKNIDTIKLQKALKKGQYSYLE